MRTEYARAVRRERRSFLAACFQSVSFQVMPPPTRRPTYLLGGSAAACAAAPTYLPLPVYTPASYVTSKRTKRSAARPMTSAFLAWVAGLTRAPILAPARAVAAPARAIAHASAPTPRSTLPCDVTTQGSSELAEPLSAALRAQWAYGFPIVPKPGLQHVQRGLEPIGFALPPF